MNIPLKLTTDSHILIVEPAISFHDGEKWLCGRYRATFACSNGTCA